MSLLGKGNRKLGPDVLTWSQTAGRTCPGASDYCAAKCYAKKGSFRWSTVAASHLQHADMTEHDLDAWRILMSLELDRKAAGSVVRIHVAGDFHSAAYVNAWRELAADHPALVFYFYTRSHVVPEIMAALELLRSEPNVHGWASTDYSMGDAPTGWNEARLFTDDAALKDAGYVKCPEQAGRKASCSDCGLCWKTGRSDFRLGFVEH